MQNLGATDVNISIINPIENAIIIYGEGLTHLNGKIDATPKPGGWQVQLVKENIGEIIETHSDLYEQTQYIVHHWHLTSPIQQRLKLRCKHLLLKWKS